ncbi:MAG: hypothetical protein AB7S44_03040 [Spirochaetales bacterium]
MKKLWNTLKEILVPNMKNINRVVKYAFLALALGSMLFVPEAAFPVYALGWLAGLYVISTVSNIIKHFKAEPTKESDNIQEITESVKEEIAEETKAREDSLTKSSRQLQKSSVTKNSEENLSNSNNFTNIAPEH